MLSVQPQVSASTVQDSGSCYGCGRTVFPLEGHYEINFDFFPRRRVRKKHKVKQQRVRYCRRCFERRDPLMFFVDGKPHFVDRSPSQAPDLNTEVCPICEKRLYDLMVVGGVYALAAIYARLGKLGVNSFYIATFCGECALEHDINFAVTTAQLMERN